MGKTTISNMFRDLNVPVWCADNEVNELYKINGAATKILSNELFFVDIGTLKLGSFEEKNIELRPGEYEILVKRRGKATSRTEIEIPSNSSTITFQIICSESKCSVNKE